MRGRLTPVIGALLLSVALVGIMPAAASTGSTVTVAVTVEPRLSAEFAADSVTVHANAPWRLSATGPDGEPLSVHGAACDGRVVVLPEGATGVALWLE